VTIGLWYWGRRGGGSRFTRSVAHGLKQAGAGVAASLSADNDVARLWREDAGVPVRWVHIGPTTLPDVASLLAGRLGEWYQAQGCDAVVFTMAHPFLLPSLAAVQRAGIAPIVVVHDAALHPGDHGRFVHALTRMAARRAAAIVTLSQHVAAEVVRSWHSAAPVYVMPHGPLYPEATRVSSRNGDGGVRFLYFGRFRAYKGIELLLDAWPAVHAELPDAELSVVGQGDDHAWRHRARALPGVRVENRWVADAEVPAVFADCDAVVLPYAEASQSGVIPLAHDMGVRVVATKVGGIAEQVGPGDVLVEPTVGGLVKGMLQSARNAPSPSTAPVPALDLGLALDEIVRRVVSRG